jgi:hypothetical protein
VLLRDSDKGERQRPGRMTADPRARLDDSMRPACMRAIYSCGTRKELDAVTRRLWKHFDNGLNDAELLELKKRIIERREMLDRNDPR